MDKKRTAKLTSDYVNEAVVKSIVNESLLINTQPVDNYEEEFYNQLGDFKKNNSNTDKFKNFNLVNKIGVDVFMYRPNSKLKSALFITGAKGLMQASDVVESTNIAKVILLPKDYSGDLKIGDLVILSVAKTVGEGYTPEFMMLHQEMNGNMEPNLPEGLKVKCPKIVTYFYESALVAPHEFKKFSQDITTFAIDEFEIFGKYEF